MTAGSGIVHSERAGEDLHSASRLHGIQSWMALPEDLQEIDPAFVHYPADDLPEFEHDGVRVRVIIGEAFGKGSPVSVHAPMLYLECRMPAGSELTAPHGYDDIAVYVVSGELSAGGQTVAERRMAVAEAGRLPRLRADSDCHLLIVGGADLGKRHIWWNFVSSSRERIEQAGQDWREGRFDGVPGDDEFIPLPE